MNDFAKHNKTHFANTSVNFCMKTLAFPLPNLWWGHLSNLHENSNFTLQVFNEVSSREMEKIDVLSGILNNYVFVGVLSATVFFQIIIVEWLGTFANTWPLTMGQWFFCVSIGFFGMPIAAFLKMVPVGSTWRRELYIECYHVWLSFSNSSFPPFLFFIQIRVWTYMILFHFLKFKMPPK